jgi:hypothetical protein
MQYKLSGGSSVKKVLFAVALVACFASLAVAADTHSYRASRPDVVAGGTMHVPAFVNVPETEAAKTLVFTSDFDNDFVEWFNASSGKELGSITGLDNPQALAIDAKKNLYVANTGESEVLIYASPYNKSPKVLSDSGYYTVGVAQFNNGEYVAATNIFSTSDEAGSVALFKNGKLVKQITNSAFFYYYFCAFDKDGNLYIDGKNEDDDVVIGEVPGAGKGKTTLNVLTTENSIEFPGGVAVTSKGLIAIDDQEAFAVYSYNPPKKGSLGKPVDTTDLSGVGDPVTIAFTSTDKDLWEADASDLNLGEYAYPKGGDAVKTISVSGASELIGVAVSPAEIP